MLDTNIAGYVVSGRSQMARMRMVEARKHGTVALSAVTQGEILYGLLKRPEPTRLRGAVGELIEAVQVLAWDSVAAHAYGTLRARLERLGRRSSAMDMMIAAHAMVAGAKLVTHDAAFERAGLILDVVDWAADLQA